MKQRPEGVGRISKPALGIPKLQGFGEGETPQTTYISFENKGFSLEDRKEHRGCEDTTQSPEFKTSPLSLTAEHMVGAVCVREVPLASVKRP